MIYYTGIGSRTTPPTICRIMTNLAKELASCDMILRSGNAGGADTAFYLGHSSVEGADYEIYLPWPNFGDIKNEKFIPLDQISTTKVDEAIEIVKNVHPAWDKLSQGAKKLHTRNVFQVLGQDLKTPSLILYCWTEDGKIQGGTATAIRIAKEYKIPVHNFGN